MAESVKVCNVSSRKRGRPAGIDHVPLSLVERRARKAEYERERRVVINDALDELATAAGLPSNMLVDDLLAEVITFVATSATSKQNWDADTLRRCNVNLESQIKLLEDRLASEPGQRPSAPAALQLPSTFAVKRKVRDCDWPALPSKRLSPGTSLSTVPSLIPVQLSTCQRDQPSFAPESQRHSVPEWNPQLHSSCNGGRPLVFPLICRENLPTSSGAVPDSPSAPVPALSPSYCDIVDTKDEDCAQLSAVWSGALNAAAGSQLTFNQIDFWATEEDLVALYL